jgi:hypothetical protein
VVVVVVGAGTVLPDAMAWICAGVSPEREPMPPRLLLMAFWIEVADEPFLPLP